MVGGDTRALLYRERATGQFHAINPPPVAIFADITGVSLPRPDRAWVTTNFGEIWAGTLEGSDLDGSDWTWKREDADDSGDSLSRDSTRHNRPLWAIAIDASGHGYAVGENGTIIERTGDGTPPWRRIDAGVLDELHSVTLGPGGKGALIGGDGGMILTETSPGHFVPARFADRYDPTNKGPWTWISRVSGVALLAGPKEGQVEAWATSQTPGIYRPAVPAILHYSSDSSEPLLDGVAKGAESLGDSPPRASDRLSFAAFGNSACQANAQGLGATTPFGTAQPCMELTGNNQAHERVALRVRDELLARGDNTSAPDFNLFTGDVGSLGGTPRNVLVGTPLIESAIHDRWREFVADPLAEAGSPVFGAIGPRDLGTTASTCQPYGAQRRCDTKWPQHRLAPIDGRHADSMGSAGGPVGKVERRPQLRPGRYRRHEKGARGHSRRGPDEGNARRQDDRGPDQGRRGAARPGSDYAPGRDMRFPQRQSNLRSPEGSTGRR
jgi:hypothetical protein